MALSAGPQSVRSSLRLGRFFLRPVSTSKTRRLYLTTVTCQKCHQQKPTAFYLSNTGIGVRLLNTRTIDNLHNVNAQSSRPRRLCTHTSEINLKDTEERALLQAVNTLPCEELYLYQYFTKPISAGIIKLRETTGGISSIEDLLKVSGMTNDRLEKLCYSINKKILKSAKQSSITGLGSSIHPRLRLNEIPKCVVSVHIHLPHVSWIRMTHDLVVDDWQTVSLVDEKKKLKYDHAVYQRKVWELCSRVPRADLYLLEEALLRVNTTQIMPTLNRNYMEAALTTALTLRHCPPAAVTPEPTPPEQLLRSPDGTMVDPEGKLSDSDSHPGADFRHVVYKLKPKAVSEHFQLLVGGERTSSLRVLSDIMQGSCRPAEGVLVQPGLWGQLWELPKVLQEQRTQTLLAAATFYKLLSDTSEQ